ncbi:hypothetical protein DL89DRAFT_322800 [Linderina pennispora]|uniref:Fe2OG dioxygenase domain-containing protein n=1 Tax=Linderina pennispora TaxID=61395 RepID=A0A1Y1W7A3_9FUNG|nr:uncharacterized protein DL89DRAFT_322800 [Linderina pennispora]ORX69427.1 hypothetical protein DL89DRAFT_322800 [Linderina pennispora]
MPEETTKKPRVDLRSDFPHGKEDSDLHIRLNPSLLTADFTTPFHTAYTSDSLSATTTIASGDSTGTIVASPFHTGKLTNVFPKHFLLALKEELKTLTWHHRSNDLYKFNQTDDLALNALPHIKALRDYMAGEEFVGFMESITGLELTRGYLDLAAQRYKSTNHLLCHDDDVHRGKLARRIAYIIYLVDEEWSAEDGGALGLFGNDENRHPTSIQEHIVPEFNSMGFFRTGLVSYHTVEEVTVKDLARERWSVTGWFYGPVTPEITPDPDHLPHLPASVLPAVADLTDTSCELEKWVNPDYLKPETQTRILDALMEQSSVELRDFLRSDVFEKVSQELSDGFWSEAPLMGPPNLRQYLAAEPTTPLVKDLAGFLRSKSFASLLKSLTSLDLIKGSQELRKFSHGHYTLIHDQALEPNGLDVTLSLTQKTDWDDEAWGGATHYIADADELLRIQPATNSLALVLRDEGVLRFTGDLYGFY